jgi:hypothetical protein
MVYMLTLDSNNLCPCYIVYIKLNKTFSFIYTIAYILIVNFKYLHILYIKQVFVNNYKNNLHP